MAEEDVLDIPIMEYKSLAEQSKFLEKPINVPKQIATTYTLDGWELVPTTDIRKMTTAQYIDFQTFSKEGEDKLIEVLSCFLIPKGKKYNEDYDILKVQQALRDYLTIPNCLALSAFFLAKFNRSIRGMLIYSKWIARMRLKKGKEKKEILMKIDKMMKEIPSGDGFHVLMQ